MVWDVVTALLSNPDEVVALANEYFGAADEQESDAPLRLAKVRGEIEAVEQALGRATATLLKAGSSHGAIRGANSSLEAELAQLRSVEERLAGRVDRAGQTRSQAEGPADLAKVAADRITVLDDRQRREVLEILGVKATVVGWHECEACGGSGKMKGGKGGWPCERCHQSRRIPQIVLTGEVRGRYADADVWQQEGGVPTRCPPRLRRSRGHGSGLTCGRGDGARGSVNGTDERQVTRCCGGGRQETLPRLPPASWPGTERGLRARIDRGCVARAHVVRP